MLNLNKSSIYLLLILKIATYSLLYIIDEVYLCDILLITLLMFFLYLLQISQLCLHNQNLTLSIVKLVSQYICLIHTFIWLQRRQAIIYGFTSFYTFLMGWFSKWLVIDISLLVHFQVIHQINLTIALYHSAIQYITIYPQTYQFLLNQILFSQPSYKRILIGLIAFEIQKLFILSFNLDMEDPKEEQHKKEDKTYIKSKKKWKDFQIHPDLIDALFDDGKANPTRVQSETLEITVNPDRKKFNLLIRAANGSGKTMSFVVPILNSIQVGVSTAEDKSFKGKVQVNQIFKPQGIIIVQTNILQDQLQRILKQYQQFGENKKSEKLRFKVGRMDKEKHEHGDIIVTMPKSFMNRYQRGNLNLDNCKFIAIDEVDDIFEQEKQTLAEILKIAQKNRPNVITCSATMKKQFLSFYQEHAKDVIKFNISELIHSELGGARITLQGVKNYYKVLADKSQMHKYVIGTIFKHLYEKVDKKPQVFIFFDSIDEIKDFHQYFKARASDFTSDEASFLENLTVGIIAAKKYEDGKKVQMSITQKNTVMTKFRNNETNILLATNIIARGIDVRNACFVINIGPPKTSQREAEIDLDIYLHRVGRTGRHNDKGLALTLVRKEDVDRLVGGIKKIHKIDVIQMKQPQKLVDQVKECIKDNSQ